MGPPARPKCVLPASLTPHDCHACRLPFDQDDAAIAREMEKVGLEFDWGRPTEKANEAKKRRKKECARLRMTLKRKREKEDAGAEEEAAARDAVVRAAAARVASAAVAAAIARWRRRSACPCRPRTMRSTCLDPLLLLSRATTTCPSRGRTSRSRTMAAPMTMTAPRHAPRSLRRARHSRDSGSVADPASCDCCTCSVACKL